MVADSLPQKARAHEDLDHRLTAPARGTVSIADCREGRVVPGCGKVEESVE